MEMKHRVTEQYLIRLHCDDCRVPMNYIDYDPSVKIVDAKLVYDETPYRYTCPSCGKEVRSATQYPYTVQAYETEGTPFNGKDLTNEDE